MKRQFPKVPILGLTATATSSVITDVQTILNIQGCLVLRASFNRPNLKYEVVCKSSCQKDNIDELENMLKNRFNGLTGIIYCFSIKDSEEIATELRKRGVKARAYHAQLDAKSRSSVHHSWSSNSIQVIVATVAFGMGIDKPDVRFVIHHSMPKSMENFYQESGRAGRDDHPASCILFFRFPDIFRQSTMVFTEQKGLEHLYAMVSYCLDLSRCRRAIIAQHFGERWETSDCNNMCDHCDKFSPYAETMKNVADDYRALRFILDYCNGMDERLTAQKLMDAWLGKGPPKLRPPGHQPTSFSRESCERIVALLLLDSYLVEEFHFTPYSTISYINIGPRNLPSNGELLLPLPILKAKAASRDSKKKTASSNNLPESSDKKKIKPSSKDSDSSVSKSAKKSSPTPKTVSSTTSKSKTSSDDPKLNSVSCNSLSGSSSEKKRKLSSNDSDSSPSKSLKKSSPKRTITSTATCEDKAPSSKDKSQIKNQKRTSKVVDDSVGKINSIPPQDSLCVLNKEKSFFFKKDVIVLEDKPAEEDKGKSAKDGQSEPIEISDGELDFDDYVIHRPKKKVPVVLVSDSE